MSQFLKQDGAYATESLTEIDFDNAVKLPDGGSTCDIYRTKWQRRDVFVKRLKEEYRTKPLYLDALDKEYDIGVSLRHPSLPEYREFHRDYIVMDYIDGQTLAEMIRRKDPWLSNEGHIVAMLRQLVDVVDYLHRHNVVHCDIKPDNIIITSNSRNLVLIDFDKCYTDALNDTSGHPSKYGLTIDEVGRVLIDFHGIGLVALKLMTEGFGFCRCNDFVKSCFATDVNCEELIHALNSAQSLHEEEHHRAYLAKIEERLYKAFRRKQDPKTMYKCVPRYIPLDTLRATKNITQSDIEEAVAHSDCFRLRNLASAERRGKQANDRIVVEMFSRNTVYGCCVDRKSDITIVCPTAMSEAGIGNFAYYLALIGGFNYVSKEIDEDVDDPTSFYIIPDPRRNASLTQYLDDVRRLSSKKDSWTVFIISSESEKAAALHFLTSSNANTGRESTIIYKDGFDRFYNMFSAELENELAIKSDLNQLRPAGPKNASVVIGGGSDRNAFTLRIFSELIVWDIRYMSLARTLATDIALTLGESYGEQMTDVALLKESGFGYQR